MYACDGWECWNLELAFPKSRHQRATILRGVFTSLGRQLAELCLFPKYTVGNVSKIVVYDGSRIRTRLGAWQGCVVSDCTSWGVGTFRLCALAYGHPLHIVMRSLDNVYIDRLARRYRTMHGNSTVDKDDFVRGLLSAMKAGETVAFSWIRT